MAAEQNIDAEREAFEAWGKAQGWPLHRFPKEVGIPYSSQTVESHWQGWLAARRTPSASIGEDGLPEPKYPQMKVLIHGRVSEQCGYTADQIRDAIAADRRARENQKPVGYLSRAALDRLRAGRTAALLPKALEGKDRIALFAAPPLSSEQQVEPVCRNCLDFGWEPTAAGPRRPCGFCQKAAGEQQAEKGEGA
jgi:hypothetical protein